MRRKDASPCACGHFSHFDLGASLIFIRITRHYLNGLNFDLIRIAQGSETGERGAEGRTRERRSRQEERKREKEEE